MKEELESAAGTEDPEGSVGLDVRALSGVFGSRGELANSRWFGVASRGRMMGRGEKRGQ